MKATNIKISEFCLGKQLAEDILVNTQYPIMNKDTMITEEHLEVLDVFQINNVTIYLDEEGEKQLDLLSLLPIKDSAVSPENVTVEDSDLQRKYNDLIQQFKKEFIKWESGMKPDITNVRTIILPVVEDALENHSIIDEFNSFSNPKDYLYHHCISVALLSAVISQKMGYEKGICIQMSLGGLLADSGMSKISSRVRDKKGTLTNEEFQEVKKHPIYSYKLVKDLPILKNDIKEAIFQHHERLDGSGYPKNMRLGEILQFAQIIAVADVFHAMSSETLYRTKQSPFKIIEMFKESELGKYDLTIVKALTELIVSFSVGSIVELSNSEYADVLFLNANYPTRPLVKLRRKQEIVDLSQNKAYHINRVIQQ